MVARTLTVTWAFYFLHASQRRHRDVVLTSHGHGKFKM